MTHREPDPITTGLWYGVFALMCLIPYWAIPSGYLFNINHKGIGPTGNFAVIAALLFCLVIRGFSKTLYRRKDKMVLAVALSLFVYGFFGTYYFQNYNITPLLGLVAILGGYGAGLGAFTLTSAGKDAMPFLWRWIKIGAIPLLLMPAFVTLTINDLEPREWMSQMYGFGNVRALGQYASLAIMVMISATGHVLLTKSKLTFTIHLIFLTGLWSVVAWTGSRGSILAVIIAYAAVSAWIGRKAIKEIIINAAVASIGVATSTLYTIPHNAFGIVDRVAAAANVVHKDTGNITQTINTLSSSRLSVWSWTIERIADHPWIGSGYLFMTALPRDERPSVVHAHNIILDYMVGFGIPVAVITLLVIFTLWVKAMLVVRRMPSAGNVTAACVITMLPIYSMLAAGLTLPFELAVFGAITGSLLGADLHRRNAIEGTGKAEGQQSEGDSLRETLFV